jgi:hypothetical protein
MMPGFTRVVLPERRPNTCHSLLEAMVLNPGDYYMVVTDFAGTLTHYSFCAAVGASCSLPAGSMMSQVPALSRDAVRRGGVK